MKISEKYKLAKKLIKEGQKSEADKILESLILQIGSMSNRGIEEAEGVSIERWRIRFWTTLEKAGLMPQI